MFPKTRLVKKNEMKKRTSTKISLMDQAISLYENGDLKKAKNLFEKIIARENSNTHAHYFLGVIAKTQAKYAEAIKHYEKVVSLDPGYVNAHFNLGGIFIDLKQYESATKSFSQVMCPGTRLCQCLG
jgi:Tfp pilus assembly protein PilF